MEQQFVNPWTIYHRISKKDGNPLRIDFMDGVYHYFRGAFEITTDWLPDVLRLFNTD